MLPVNKECKLPCAGSAMQYVLHVERPHPTQPMHVTSRMKEHKVTGYAKYAQHTKRSVQYHTCKMLIANV